MISRDGISLIGKFNKPHGINGEISAIVNVPIDVLNADSCILCEIDGAYVPFFINDIRQKSHDSVLLSIDDINNENDAMMLVNKDIFLSNDVYNQLLEDEDQLPVDFFIGFKTTINTVHHGTIVDIDDSTANVLFVIEIENGKSLLVPAVDEFITDINSVDRTIEMVIPNELLEL